MKKAEVSKSRDTIPLIGQPLFIITPTQNICCLNTLLTYLLKCSVVKVMIFFKNWYCKSSG